MKTLLCVGTAVVFALASSGSMTPARAADLGVDPIYKAPPAATTWTGSYIGAAGGGAWGSAVVSNDAAGVDAFRIGTTSVTAGFGIQSGNLVLGYEGDTSIKSRNGSTFDLPPNSAFSDAVRERWLSTFRGRLGFAQDNWLFYATVGGAFGNLERSIVGPPGQISERYWHWGVAAGGGVEVKITHDWSAKVEYLYVGLQDKPFFNPAPNTSNQRVHLDDHIVRFGVNYKLPWSVLDTFFNR